VIARKLKVARSSVYAALKASPLLPPLVKPAACQAGVPALSQIDLPWRRRHQTSRPPGAPLGAM
jgi:hypothetical protein